MSLISSINIAQQALSVNQTAITTVSNNIANVDTVGYHKLRTNLASVSTYGAANSAVSIANSLSGVQVANIQRYSNFSKECYCWQEESTSAYLDQYASSATTVQDLVNELNDTGLANALTNFYDAADSLSDSPSDITARQNYVSAADNLCTVFNNVSSNLDDVQESLVGNTVSVTPSELSDNVKDVNDILDQLAEVNKNIVKTNSLSNSNPTLLDQRDALITKLSELIPVNAKENDNSTVSISLGNISLVQGVEVQGYLSASNSLDVSGNLITKISVVDTEGNTKIDDVNSKIDSGSIGAILDLCGTDSTKLTISGIKNTINNLASQFASTLNNIQLNADASGTPLCIDKATNTLTATTAADAIFVNKNGLGAITAENISVNSVIIDDPYRIAAARTDTTSATYSNTQIGNNSNMADVLAVRTTTYAALDNMDMEDYLASAVSKVGTGVKDIMTSQETQAAVLSSAQSSLASETGVNLDEELMDLMKYQQAYQAAARIFSTCNDLLESLIHMAE